MLFILLITVSLKSCSGNNSVVATLIRIHLISMLDLNQLLRSNNREFNKQINDPPGQMTINRGGVY